MQEGTDLRKLATIAAPFTVMCSPGMSSSYTAHEPKYLTCPPLSGTISPEPSAVLSFSTFQDHNVGD